MRCQSCLKGNLERVAGKKYRCLACGAEGTVKDIQVQALGRIDDRYAWYYCPELDCRLFYRTTYRGQCRPVVRMRVWCPPLGDYVTIELLGVGERGGKEKSDLFAFPVDLWHRPYVLDPRPSRTVDQDLMDEWQATVAFALARLRGEDLWP